jgi:hypothetical protein
MPPDYAQFDDRLGILGRPDRSSLIDELSNLCRRGLMDDRGHHAGDEPVGAAARYIERVIGQMHQPLRSYL